MKEAIGGTWLFGIVIVFVILFATIVSVSVNWSRAYKVKDEIINQIEKNNGFNDDTKAAIDEYIGGLGYRSTGECPDDGDTWYGVVADGTMLSRSRGYRGKSGKNYCIKRTDINRREKNSLGQCVTVVGAVGLPEAAYYSVAVFFKLDMPIIGSIFELRITGETSTLYNINDDVYFPSASGKDC